MLERRDQRAFVRTRPRPRRKNAETRRRPTMFSNRQAVLHIDDDPVVTEHLGRVLNKAGYETTPVHDPLQAMSELIRGQHRIVLLDIHMPSLSGLELLQEIKRVDAGVQVLMLTGFVSESTVLEASRLGAEAFFFKPLEEPAPLIAAIEDAFRRNERWWNTMRELNALKRAKEADCAV